MAKRYPLEMSNWSAVVLHLPAWVYGASRWSAEPKQRISINMNKKEHFFNWTLDSVITDELLYFC
jgi:hypothetical protein